LKSLNHLQIGNGQDYKDFQIVLSLWGSNGEVRKQIGNAVPPMGIYEVVREIERVLIT
jgi:site-specific DNA-cytosine methylase